MSSANQRPFVTIGVTTYNRHELLRQTLQSILAQTFDDYEVIVGNDYTAEVLTGEMLGISDPRIRFVNHPVNLREVGNMNALLEMAWGRYFTWLFDDDLYEPDFLQIAHDCLHDTGLPPVFFSTYRILVGDEPFQPQRLHYQNRLEFSGREFLHWYSPLRIPLFPTFGLFDTQVLRDRVGGFEELSPAEVGLYSEYHFLIKCGLFERIVYADAPFYVYRQHEGSWSEASTDLSNYRAIARVLLRRCSEVLKHPTLAEDYSANLLKVCSLHLIELAHKSGRHILYVSSSEQNRFGIAGAFRIMARHWRETWDIWTLYRSLGGDNRGSSLLTELKVILFCNYLMLSHFFHYFYKKKAN